MYLSIPYQGLLLNLDTAEAVQAIQDKHPALMVRYPSSVNEYIAAGHYDRAAYWVRRIADAMTAGEMIVTIEPWDTVPCSTP